MVGSSSQKITDKEFEMTVVASKLYRKIGIYWLRGFLGREVEALRCPPFLPVVSASLHRTVLRVSILTFTRRTMANSIYLGYEAYATFSDKNLRMYLPKSEIESSESGLCAVLHS